MAPARKRFGQHWLRSQPILQRIVAAAALSDRDCVLEIGPGQGVLTRQLLAQAGHVVAIEIDRDLCHQLAQHFTGVDRLQLVQGDILQLDLAQVLHSTPDFPPPNKVVANIPYYITGPILAQLLGSIAQPRPQPFETIVLLVQREIADRLCASPGSRVFGSLSVTSQYLADCEVICTVPPEAFRPAPKVTSAVVRLQPRPFPILAQSPRLLQQLVKVGFANKRKMLRNNLSSIIDRTALLSLLSALEIAETARAEALSVADWVTLSNKMLEEGYGSTADVGETGVPQS